MYHRRGAPVHKPLNICIFDNYDSFTYNLVSLFRSVRKKANYHVIRNRDRRVFDIDFDVFVISPGPMGPEQTGYLKELFHTTIVPKKIPVFGVCLGMQFLASFFSGAIGQSQTPVHGRVVRISHNGDDLFRGIKKRFQAMRYNSLEVKEIQTDDLKLLAEEESSGAIMALRHVRLPFAGVQFHPDSFLTHYSKKLISNFFKYYVED
jgi:anthranilate synthase/aminodeoxychorismate synthase-like glutamine amidotransferase